MNRTKGSGDQVTGFSWQEIDPAWIYICEGIILQ